MTGSEILQHDMDVTDYLVTQVLDDLMEVDILVRPAGAANHIAWQLGHIIDSEPQMVLGQLQDVKYPEFPAGFGPMHAKENASKDEGFLSKDEYLRLYKAVRAVTKEAIAKLSDADLDKPTTGDMAKWFPKLGMFCSIVANHPQMHVGQFSVVRRKLGKPHVM